MGAGQSAVADALHQLFLVPALAVRLIGSEVVGFNLWVAMPFPLAAIGAWLFFRRRFAADASALGAIAFSLSGPIVSTGNFPNLSWSAAAIPWMLWAVDRVTAAATPRHIAALAVVTALQAFAGEPVTLLATLVVGLTFAAMVSPSPAEPFARRARLLRRSRSVWAWVLASRRFNSSHSGAPLRCRSAPRLLHAPPRSPSTPRARCRRPRNGAPIPRSARPARSCSIPAPVPRPT